MLKLLRFLKPVWGQVVVSVFAMAFQAFFALLIPNFMANITSIMEHPENYASRMTGLISFGPYAFIAPTGNRMTDTWIIGGIMLAFAAAFLFFAFASSIINSHIGATYAKEVRHEVFKKTISMSLGEYDKIGTASLITRTTNDIEQTQNAVQFGLRIMITAPISFAIAIVMIFTRDNRLALIVACALPFIIITAVVLFIITAPLFKKVQTAIDKLTSTLRESLKGVRVIRAFNQENKEYRHFKKANKELTNISIKTARAMSFGNPLIAIVFDFTYIVIFYYGFAKISGTPSNVIIDFTNIIVSGEYAMELMQAFIMFMFLFILIPRADACAKRINEVLESQNPIREPTIVKTPTGKEGVVVFSNVSFAFPGASKPTLKNISFTTHPGKTTAIIGSTGSGKSTIVNLIPRFYDVTKGSITIDGLDIREYSQAELRKKLGLVPQTAQLFSGTLRDNITFGKADATDEEIEKALEVAQAKEFTDKLPQKLATPVEQDGKNFSGGQKQRLSIARALVKKPEIYLFDDCFSALDFETDFRLRQALKTYAARSSVLIVAQRVSTIIDADNIIVLDNGVLVGEGTHQELLRTCRVYQEIVNSQLDKNEIGKTMNLLQTGGSENAAF